MHDFRAYILPNLPPQRGLSAIAELLVYIFVADYDIFVIVSADSH